MSFKSLLFVTLACLIYKNEASDIQKVLPQAQVILQKFLNIVEANQLNVSIVTSQAINWSNGQLHQMRDSALLLPPNHVHLTQTQLTQQVGKQWLADLQSWTSQGHGIVTYRVIRVENGAVSQQLVESSNLEQIPVSPSYESILEPEVTGEDGLVEEFEDYEVMYNFRIPGAGGHDQITNVFAVSLNITIIANSEHMPLTEINKIKEVLSKIWMMFHEDELRAKYLAHALDTQIPQSDTTWQVLVGPGDFFIPSGKWVQLSIADTNVVVFAVAA
ncbi:uncharacterized protein LOC108907079 [Anoplophora glabripennis]|uniref:uncharacterized protein LOC108907079 n=1 Tax=Anoplophora glabripennis TaxID=217634 RepID=UPI000874E4D4|nr:uncharacterized protein LOC108907079 [Anoplophora glabripennis]